MTSLNDHLPFVVSSLVLFFYPLFSKASNTLLQGQTLEDSADQTLISPGKVFELGFFSLTAGRNHRYLGIYYHNISPQSIVWIANRDTPLSDSSGTLRLGTDGNLSLVDTTTGNSIWSTNSSATSSNSSASLTLEDDGRIILQLTNGTVNWDSFDHPTDTFLPGMKVLLDIRTGRRTLFRSWRSADDPSAGNYSLGLDASGQIFIWEGKQDTVAVGPVGWHQVHRLTMRPLYLYGFHPTNDVENGLLYFTYAQMNSSLLRFVLQWNGVENTTMLVEETRQGNL
ncbi:hypothetical protein HPP92_017633 [Vanilla planifolia]|uniref:Bulb-type lectin domain-containing protein n=1 Tax=Vanilla planifolia TaxID=51239 RepID=A0A835UR74_VANPL|nr:hypothetical protein HPP92_017633 [Vanilla planifolia]